MVLVKLWKKIKSSRFNFAAWMWLLISKITVMQVPVTARTGPTATAASIGVLRGKGTAIGFAQALLMKGQAPIDAHYACRLPEPDLLKIKEPVLPAV
jgi:hypothetical protein